MTNHNEDTQDQPVNRPTRGKIAIEAVFTAAMLATLVWLIVWYPEEPRWYDRAGVLAYALFTGWFLSTTVAMVKRYRAPRPVVAYTDRQGDVWTDVGTTYGQDYVSNAEVGTYPLEYVEREFGPLTPVTE